MAPEQAGGENVDDRCDLFSLGCVLYRLCTGELPFKGNDTLAIMSRAGHGRPRSRRVRSTPRCRRALSDLVMQLLAKKPEERPQSAQVVAEALQEIEAQTGEATARPAPRPRTCKARGTTRRRRLDADWPGRRRNGCRWPGWWAAVCLAWPWWDWLHFSCCGPATSGEPGSVRTAPPPSKQPEALPATFTNSLGMEFVLVPKGKSWLGGGGGKPGDKEVEIADDFYLGKYEVTQEEWEKVMGSNPSHFSRTGGGKDAVKDISDADLKRFPVEQVSWDDAQLFLEQLNKREKEDGLGVSLAEGGGMGVRLSGRTDDRQAR